MTSPINPSKWYSFFSSLPTQSTYRPIDVLRRHLFSVTASAAAGVVAGWEYTNSVTRGEGSPGSAAEPARKYWHGVGTSSTKWVKAVLTWSGGNMTKMALYFSEDNESTYVPMLDDSNNYVLTLSYSGSNLTATTWGNTP